MDPFFPRTPQKLYSVHFQKMLSNFFVLFFDLSVVCNSSFWCPSFSFLSYCKVVGVHDNNAMKLLLAALRCFVAAGVPVQLRLMCRGAAAGWWFKHQILSTTRACDVKRPRDDLDYFCYSRKIESKLRNKKAYFLLDSARNQTLILCIFWFRVKLLNPLEFPKHHYNFGWQWQVRNGFVSIPKHNIRTSSL